MLKQANVACVSFHLCFSLFVLCGANLRVTEDIKTYAVTPLNEECGLIEWVDNLRTLRELVIKLLRERGITPNVWLSLKLRAFYCLRY